MLGSNNLKSIWLLGTLAICVLSFFHHDHKVAAEDCEVDMRGLEIECMYYMNNGEPSTMLNPNDRCCKVLTGLNLPCVCGNLHRKIYWPPGATYEDMINWNKMMHCFNFCGRPLPVGYKCGKFIVPPGPPPK